MAVDSKAPGTARHSVKVRIADPKDVATKAISSLDVVSGGPVGGGASLSCDSPNVVLRFTKSEVSGPTQKFDALDTPKLSELSPTMSGGDSHAIHDGNNVKLNPASIEWKPAENGPMTQPENTPQNGTTQSHVQQHGNHVGMLNNIAASAAGRNGYPPQIQPAQPTYLQQPMGYPVNGMNGVPIQLPLNGVHHEVNGMNGNGPIQNGQYGGYAMNAVAANLQAHIANEPQYQHQNQYHPQAQVNMIAAYQPVSANGQIQMQQPIYQVAFMQGQGMMMQQQQTVYQQQTPTHQSKNGGMDGGIMSPTPGSVLFSPPGYTSESSSSPNKNGGNYLRTEPRNFAPRSGDSVTNEPPPRFALTPLPPNGVQPNTVTSPPASIAHDPFSPVDPFKGGQLSNIIQPIQIDPPVQQNALVQYNNPVPDYVRNLRSNQLNNITAGPTGRPSLDVALHPDNFPFVESARQAQGVSYGVVKLKNIPFATKRAEILAFLGRNSKVLNDNQEPVHIIMERVTSKTNDAYVEFMSMQAAVNAVEKHQKTLAGGRLSRLGDRPVEVELSSQASLMKDLFPLAKGVRWDGSHPIILDDHPTEPWNCFKGFITDEEMTMLVKHVEVPQRSPFSRDCPQRPFECMISTLRKLPWYMTDHITLRQRHSVYRACIDLLRLLQHALREKKNDDCLTPQLYKRLWTSAMLCHGFTVAMKDSVAYHIDLPDGELRSFNQPRYANMWLHQYTLSPKAGIPLDVLEWYIAVVREETARTVNQQPLNLTAQIHKEGDLTDLYWGYFWKEVHAPVGLAFDATTLNQMAIMEFKALGEIFRRAFPQ